jgi:hypothetical protein
MHNSAADAGPLVIASNEHFLLRKLTESFYGFVEFNRRRFLQRNKWLEDFEEFREFGGIGGPSLQ